MPQIESAAALQQNPQRTTKVRSGCFSASLCCVGGGQFQNSTLDSAAAVLYGHAANKCAAFFFSNCGLEFNFSRKNLVAARTYVLTGIHFKKGRTM
jgi:hypothetical protein